MFDSGFTPEEQEPFLMDAVNAANHNMLATLIVDKNDEELIFLHTKVDFIFPPGVAWPDEFLNAHLKALLRIRESLDAQLQSMRSKKSRIDMAAFIAGVFYP